MDWNCQYARLPDKYIDYLMIVEIPDNLIIPNLSSPSNFVPKWNKHKKGFLDVVFDFANTHLHDKGAIVFECKAATSIEALPNSIKNNLILLP
jgi:hypothetical protein